uniref:G-protein coupled receptors family 1 profile domain-containing protein n=1 Tax=Sinocyclocheilus grahami TaxID=75366 RepID=A0A672SA78_SINGR
MKTTTSISNVSLQPDVHNHSALHSCNMDESYKYIILPLCYSLTFLLSLVLNSTVLLWSYQCRSGPQWNTSLIYMVNLASPDLIYSFSLPFLVASYVMRDHWVFGDFMCRLVRFLFYFNLYCSIFFLTCISVHRYMGICHPIRTIALERLGMQEEGGMRRKSIKTIITITILFCQTMRMVSICYKITRPLASCNSWLNALLYFITGEKSLACCGRTNAGHNTHLLWPLQILGGQKEAEDQEQGNSHKAEEAHESDSKSSGIT